MLLRLFLNKEYLDKLTNSRNFPQKLSSSQNVLTKDQLLKLRILKQLKFFIEMYPVFIDNLLKDSCFYNFFDNHIL